MVWCPKYRRGTRYDWGDDCPLLTPLEDSVVYELHVRGFTWHPSAGVRFPGTYAGLVTCRWIAPTRATLSRA